MFWRILCHDTASYDNPIAARDYFDRLVLIWRTQSQSVNRRLFGSTNVDVCSEEHHEVYQCASRLVDASMLHVPPEEACEVRKLISKNTMFSQMSYELSYNEEGLSAVFIPVFPDESKNLKTAHIPYPYRITCENPTQTSLRLILSVPTQMTDVDCRWLLNAVFPVLFKWLRFLDPEKVMRKTNNLVDIEEYSSHYRRIKEKYGRSLVKRWTEKTDPKKFVYEDCGIATYLLELWRKRSRFPKKFADLGCGNGLLVYLLNKEGISGIGIDIRKRKIWSDLLSDATLVEGVVDPSQKENAIPSDVDYLIGNHTDELTPWIPILAARSGDTGSQYDSFLKFVREVAIRLGFVVEEDRLSIPSTKRVCFVGSIPLRGLVPNLEDVIGELTQSPDKIFIPRPKVEKIRNCLNIPAELRVVLTKRFFNEILYSSEELRNGWRCGGAIELAKLAAMLTESEKDLMKQQCGGLQTFLRNQHQVFKRRTANGASPLDQTALLTGVTGGTARLRDFREEQSRKPKKPKGDLSRNGVTPCWMAENHPDGCPMKQQCKYKH